MSKRCDNSEKDKNSSGVNDDNYSSQKFRINAICCDKWRKFQKELTNILSKYNSQTVSNISESYMLGAFLSDPIQ